MGTTSARAEVARANDVHVIACAFGRAGSSESSVSQARFAGGGVIRGGRDAEECERGVAAENVSARRRVRMGG
jgi:hypothetical protein